MGMPMPTKLSARDRMQAAKAAAQAKAQAAQAARAARKAPQMVSELPDYVIQAGGDTVSKMPPPTKPAINSLPTSTIKGGSTGGGYNTPTGKFDPSTAPPLPEGAVYKKGGKVSASRRADGIAQRGKTRGKYI